MTPFSFCTGFLSLVPSFLPCSSFFSFLCWSPALFERFPLLIYFIVPLACILTPAMIYSAQSVSPGALTNLAEHNQTSHRCTPTFLHLSLPSPYQEYYLAVLPLF